MSHEQTIAPIGAGVPGRGRGQQLRVMRAVAGAFEEVLTEHGRAGMAALIEAYHSRRDGPKPE